VQISIFRRHENEGRPLPPLTLRSKV
jgi:hypothetical protein